jgi:peptidyl-prolyl cis-trans isomerase A (cyclophilin A)
MHRMISASMIVLGLAVSPLIAQTTTTPPPTRRGVPPPARPAAPTPAKPAAPAAQSAGPAAPAVKLDPGTYAHVTTTNGNFTARLFVEDAPKTVENFVGLATGKKAWKNPRTNAMAHTPYFNNVLFHRIIPNFMIQGGDPTGTGMGGPGYEFPDEISPKHHHDKAGMLSMANHGPNTNGGQFFITVAPYPSLDGHYSIFGEIVDGLDNVIAISKVPRSMSGPTKDRPLTPVAIKTVRIEVVK